MASAAETRTLGRLPCELDAKSGFGGVTAEEGPFFFRAGEEWERESHCVSGGK